MSYSNPAAYDRFMGRWSARLSPIFLDFAGVQDGQHVLDVGCGTGSLSHAVVRIGEESKVTGVDPVPAYVAFARETVPDFRAQFQVGCPESLPFPGRMFDAALALLVLQDFADPWQAVSEMVRVTRPGGVVAATLWDFRDGLPMLSLFRQAAEAVAPEMVLHHRSQSSRREHSTPDDLAALWQSCGLSAIKIATLELPMEFSSFDDYWQPFLGGATPTSALAVAVNEQTGGALTDLLRNKLTGARSDVGFIIPARAFAIKGTA
jgi:SAM-dependent methyltransferase